MLNKEGRGEKPVTPKPKNVIEKQTQQTLINVIFENAGRYQRIKELIGVALKKELIPDNTYTGEYEVLEQIKKIIEEDYNV